MIGCVNGVIHRRTHEKGGRRMDAISCGFETDVCIYNDLSIKEFVKKETMERNFTGTHVI